MNEVQINKMIEIKANILAKKMFDKFKKGYVNKKRKSSISTRKYDLAQIMELEDNSTLKLIYQILERTPNLDRHEILRRIEFLSPFDVVQSTVSGRIWDLKNSNLVYVSGKHIGRQGKTVQVYSINKGGL